LDIPAISVDVYAIVADEQLLSVDVDDFMLSIGLSPKSLALPNLERVHLASQARIAWLA
jgi:hypothetical protein